jgi:hypothetical protein
MGNFDTISTGWSTYSDTLPGITLQISAVSVSKNPANIVWYGTTGRRVYKVVDAHIGDPQHLMMPISQFPAANVSSIAINPQNADEVVVVFSNYGVYSLFYTLNGGVTWIQGAGNLEEFSNGGGSGSSLRSVSILPRPDGTLYFVGTSTGLYATYLLDSLDTEWTQVGTNFFGNVIVEMVQTRETDGLVVVGTHGKGVYTTRINQVSDLFPGVSVEEERASDLRFNIYPNPVADILNLDFDTQLSSPKIEILDINGRLIFSYELNPAKQQVDVSSLPAGTYICRVLAKEGEASRRFVVR